MQFENVTVSAEGNVYFEGRVVSHTILLADGSRKTIGVILPGSYHFGTEAAERMDIVCGACTYVVDGSTVPRGIAAGESFAVAANSGFTITVKEECHYVCSFL